MILFISRTATQACFPSVLVHNCEIKLLQYIPEKLNLLHSDLPTSERLSKDCHSSEAQISRKEATVWKQNTNTEKSSEFQPDQVFGYLQTPLGALSTKCTWKVTKVFEWWTPAYCWPAENERFDRNGKEKGDPAFQILTEGSNQFNFNYFKAVSFCAHSSIWLYNV